MNKTIKIKNNDRDLKLLVLDSLVKQRYVHSRNQRNADSIPFSLKSVTGLLKVYGDISLSEISEGLKIKISAKTGLTTGGIVAAVILICTIIGIVLLLLWYLLESYILDRKLSDTLLELKAEFE